MHVLEAFQELVDYVLLVNFLKNVGSDDGVEIGVHEVKNEVDVFVVLSPDDVLESDYVFMSSQFLQENDFSESALGVGSVLEGVEVLLERTNFFGSFVDGLPDDAVRSFAQFLDDLVLLENVGFDFFRHESY